MGFLQIITFGTDRFDEFLALEHAWSEGTVASAPASARSLTPTATGRATTSPSTGSTPTSRPW